MFPSHIDLAQLQGLPPALLGQPLYPLSATGHPLLPPRANTQMQLAVMQQQLQQQRPGKDKWFMILWEGSLRGRASVFACLFKGAKYKVIFVFGFYPVGKIEFGRLSNLVWLPETALSNSIQQFKKKKISENSLVKIFFGVCFLTLQCIQTQAIHLRAKAPTGLMVPRGTGAVLLSASPSGLDQMCWSSHSPPCPPRS